MRQTITLQRATRAAVLALMTALLAACGGGDDLDDACAAGAPAGSQPAGGCATVGRN